ncbi:hypothetical protein ACQCVH_01890 [Bacillus infantis]|uniref:hypothetical protein n=1 Tax=Bacillus infantis TaxID=324767 RepID=UPI003CF2E3CC
MKNKYKQISEGRFEVFFNEVVYDGRSFANDGERKIVRIVENQTSKVYTKKDFEKLNNTDCEFVKISLPIFATKGFYLVPTGKYFNEIGFWTIDVNDGRQRFISLKKLLNK